MFVWKLRIYKRTPPFIYIKGVEMYLFVQVDWGYFAKLFQSE